MYANTLYTKILPIYRRRYVIMCIVFDVLDITPHVTYFKTSDKYWEYVPWGVYNTIHTCNLNKRRYYSSIDRTQLKHYICIHNKTTTEKMPLRSK